MGVFWVLASIMYYYNTKNSAITHKYLNHGRIVPAHKCFKFNKLVNNYHIRLYSTYSDNKSLKVYEDAYSMRKSIIKDNKNLSGIYKFTNKLTKEIYVGQSINLAKRFLKYFTLSYLKSRESLVMSRALIKYGYSNFSLEILEYCEIANLTEREQFYIDKLNPNYNTLKIAGSSSGYKHTEETKNKISQSLKGVYVAEKAYWYGRSISEETKKLMSLKRSGELNPLYGKFHSEQSKELMRQKALGRKYTEETKLLMSTKRGNPVNIYEKCSSEGFKLIGSFVSARRAGKFLGMSGSTVNRYMNSGAIFKDRYKFSSK